MPKKQHNTIVGADAHDHNDLGSLDSGDFQHLTQSEHDELTSWLDDVTLSDGGSMDIGSGNFTTTGTGRFDNGLVDSFSTQIFDIENQQLIDANGSGAFVFDSSSRLIQNTSGVTTGNFVNGQLLDGSSVVKVSWIDGKLHDSSGNFDSVDWQNRLLINSSGTTVTSWNSNALANASGTTTLDWDSLKLKDASSFDSVDWGDRQLEASDGDVILDWSVSGSANFNDSDITTTGDLSIGGSITGSSGTITAKDNILFHNGTDDLRLTWRDNNIAHGITTVMATSDHGRLVTNDAADGGMQFIAITDNDSGVGVMRFRGIHGVANPGDTEPAFNFVADKKDGTGVQALAAAETVLDIRNNSTLLFRMSGNGDINAQSGNYVTTGNVTGTNLIAGTQLQADQWLTEDGLTTLFSWTPSDIDTTQNIHINSNTAQLKIGTTPFFTLEANNTLTTFTLASGSYTFLGGNAGFQNTPNANAIIQAGDTAQTFVMNGNPGGQSDKIVACTSDADGESVSFNLTVQGAANRDTRAKFFLDDAVAGSGAWGLWQTWGSSGNQPFQIGMANAVKFEIDTSFNFDFKAGNLTSTGTLNTGKAIINSGATNEVAQFISTDTDAFIRIDDDDTSAFFGTFNDTVFLSHTASGAGVSLTIDSSRNFDFQSGNITTLGDVNAANGNFSGDIDIGACNNSDGRLQVKGDGTGENIYMEESSGSEGWMLGIDADGDLNFFNSGSATPSVSFNDDNNIDFYGGNLTTTGTSDLLGECQFGDSTTENHGINTAPVALQGITASFTDATEDNSSTFFKSTFTNTAEATDVAAEVFGFDLDMNISGTLNTDIDGASRDSIGWRIILDDTSDISQVDSFGITYGVFADVTFFNIGASPDGYTSFGGSFNSNGNLGTGGGGLTEHTGIRGLASGTANTNYGGYFSAAGATNNWGIWVQAGNVRIATDNQKIQIGALATDLEIYSDGTNGVLEMTDNLILDDGAKNSLIFAINDAVQANTVHSIRGQGGAGDNLIINAVAELHLNTDYGTSVRINRDDVRLQIGGSSTDFQLWSDGTNAIIDVGTAIRIGNSVTNYTEINSTGDTTFVGGAGLQEASVYVDDNSTETTITGSGVANKVQFTNFDTNGCSNGSATPDHTNDHITIGKAGCYMVLVKITADSIAGAPSQFSFDIFINNGATAKANLHAHRDFAGGAGEVGSITIVGLATFAANDTVELWVHNETNTQNIVLSDVELSVIQVAGS